MLLLQYKIDNKIVLKIVYIELVTLTVKDDIIIKVLTVNKEYIAEKGAKVLLLEKRKSYRMIKGQLFFNR